MEIDDFKIDEPFFAGGGRWICIAKGDNHIVAMRTHEREKNKSLREYMTESSVKHYLARKDLAPAEIWWEIDFGGCDFVDRFSKLA